MKIKAICPLLVAAILAAGCSSRSPQRQEQPSGTPAQTENKDKRLAIEKTARASIASLLGVDVNQVKPDSRFIEDLKADELDMVELTMQFEEEFEIAIPDEEAAKFQVVQQAYDYLVAHVPRWPKT